MTLQYDVNTASTSRSWPTTVVHNGSRITGTWATAPVRG